MKPKWTLTNAAAWLGLLGMALAGFGAEPDLANTRKPATDADLRRWLENMVWDHRFTAGEIVAATGLGIEEVVAAVKRFGIEPGSRPERSRRGPLRVVPYPGGRHPRIGFLEGAVRPQRETKVSVFCPWDETSYVVTDVPEAIWHQDGLLYLAHTHVPTLWTRQGIQLEPLEWNLRADGSLDIERTLPNGVRFGAWIKGQRDHVAMELWLHNGSDRTLRELRVQNCVMLKGAKGFEEQSNANKRFLPPYAAAGSRDGGRWVITAWEPLHRAWANPPVPCVHSDPKFPDCAPGQTQRLRGWLSFYEGSEVEAEMRRIEARGWRQERR